MQHEYCKTEKLYTFSQLQLNVALVTKALLHTCRMTFLCHFTDPHPSSRKRPEYRIHKGMQIYDCFNNTPVGIALYAFIFDVPLSHSCTTLFPDYEACIMLTDLYPQMSHLFICFSLSDCLYMYSGKVRIIIHSRHLYKDIILFWHHLKMCLFLVKIFGKQKYPLIFYQPSKTAFYLNGAKHNGCVKAFPCWKRKDHLSQENSQELTGVNQKWTTAWESERER